MTRKTLFAIHAFGGMTANERRLGRFLRDGAGHPDPAPAPAAPEEPDAAFDAAFTEHATETPPADAGAAPAAAGDAGVGGAAPAAGEPAAAPAADPAGDGGGNADPAPVAGAGDPPAAADTGTPPAAPAPNADDVLNRLAGLINQAPQAPEPQAPQGDPEPQAPLYNEQEQAAISEYEKNWPDVAAAESLKRRGEYHDLLKYVFSQVHAFVNPLVDQMRTVGNTLHVAELKELVPDYSPVVEDEVNNWIDTQPDYLQTGMKQVMQSGTSEQVKDLIGRYRAATGAAPAAPSAAPASTPAAPAAAPATTPAAAPKTELSSAAKQAAESLAPVSGERSAVPQGEDPQDFDSAFAKYAATMPGF